MVGLQIYAIRINGFSVIYWRYEITGLDEIHMLSQKKTVASNHQNNHLRFFDSDQKIKLYLDPILACIFE